MKRRMIGVVVVSALGSLAGAQCGPGIGFLEGVVSTDGLGSVVFDSPDTIQLSYATSFSASVSTDNGSGEIGGSASANGTRSSYSLLAHTKDSGGGGGTEDLSLDAIIVVPRTVAYELSDNSNVTVVFEAGGPNPGEIFESEGMLGAGTYRVAINTNWQSDVSVEWLLSLLEPFDLISPPCAADMAEPCGVLDVTDVLAFLTAFGDMNGAADLAPPFGAWDFDDVLAYLQSYGSGCP